MHPGIEPATDRRPAPAPPPVQPDPQPVLYELSQRCLSRTPWPTDRHRKRRSRIFIIDQDREHVRILQEAEGILPGNHDRLISISAQTPPPGPGGRLEEDPVLRMPTARSYGEQLQIAPRQPSILDPRHHMRPVPGGIAGHRPARPETTRITDLFQQFLSLA